MLKKIFLIMQESVPIFIMVALIPLVNNDYFLTYIYVVIIITALYIKRKTNDIVTMLVGFVAMTFFESIFIATHVEVFQRQSLLGIMPLWLPFLWAYGFIVIKRSLFIIESRL